ncbi:MAG: DUF4215 domain-containing protein [Deltaproteobacteria bacterium]|nr:DUF4215 domain-containing protein [Deltaproteobacteria bacterium]
MYFFLDSATSPGGKYRLELSYNAPVCGDGVVSPSLMEECDDGNAVSGDGCDKDCKLEKAVAFDACPGEPFPITLNQTLTFFGNTAPYNDGDGVHSYHPVQAPGCTPSAYLSTARDRVYQLKAKANGTVTATVGLDLAGTMPICEIEPFSPFCWDRVLYAVAAIEPDTCGANCTCDSGMTIPGDSKNGKQLGAQLACSQKGLLSVEEVSFPVEKDRTYFIVVDGNTYSAYPYGPYYLRVALQ